MSFGKNLVARFLGSVLAQLALGFVGGGATAVTAMWAYLSEGSLASITLLGVSAGTLTVAFMALYRATNPPEPDEWLQERHREKIARWRNFVEEWQRGRGEIGDEEVWYGFTNEFSEIKAHMTETEKQALEEESGWRGKTEIVRDALTRLEQEWEVV